MINHVLFTAKKALTVAAVATITGLSDKRVRNHFVYLAQRGLITY
jgi:predicted ArsR family transcriptional regulator